MILPAKLVLRQQLFVTRGNLTFEQPAEVVLDRPVDRKANHQAGRDRLLRQTGDVAEKY